MRVAIVLNTSWNIYNFRRGLAQFLLDKGHQVIAIAPRDEYSDYLVEMGCEFYPVKLERKGSNPLRDFDYMRQLFRVYKESNPDIILQFTIKPNIYGTLAAIPLRKLVINNVCGLGTVFLRDDLTSKIAKLLYKISFRYANKVFFQNEDDLQLFLEHNLIKKKITDLVPGSGIPLDKFHPADFQRNEIFTFLMIARLIYDKGILEYIEAIRTLRKKGLRAKFQILGFIDEDRNLGVSREQVQAWVDEGLIDYLGTTDHVAQFIEKADCVVLPSYREGTPRSLLEAAGMAKPLITTDIAGCRQTVVDGLNGFLCKVKDADDLALKMEEMYLLDNETLKGMGKASRIKVEKEFDEKIVIQKYSKILDCFTIVQERKTRNKNRSIPKVATI